MFYEEKIIDGILHCRYSPNAEFKPMTAEQITEKSRQLEALVIQKQADIERYVAALNYIALLANIKDPHLGHPRLSDKNCIFCMTYFALNNGDYGYEISKEEYEQLFKEKKGEPVSA